MDRSTVPLHLRSGRWISVYIMEEEHFLHDVWTLYFHDPNDDKWDRASFKKIVDVSTVELFWQINALLQDKLHMGMFFLMRESIFPLWEEKENRDGGYISLKVLKTKVQEVWELLCNKVLSESILVPEHQDMWSHVNGVSVSPKKSFCIFKIWLRTQDAKDPSWYQIKTPDLSEVLYKSYSEPLKN